jgi:hypothetical protein
MLFVAASKAWALPMLAPGLTFDVVPVLDLAADTAPALIRWIHNPRKSRFLLRRGRRARPGRFRLRL